MPTSHASSEITGTGRECLQMSSPATPRETGRTTAAENMTGSFPVCSDGGAGPAIGVPESKNLDRLLTNPVIDVVSNPRDEHATNPCKPCVRRSCARLRLSSTQ